MKKMIQKSFNRLGYEIVKRPRGVEIDFCWLNHFVYFKEVYDLIAQVEGDLVECGIGSGNSFYKLCFLASREKRDRKIYGFDSFEGFPEPSEEDKSPRNPQRGEWNQSTVAWIEALLIERGQIDPAFIKGNVKLIEGFFKDSVQQYDGDKVAFLHLDVDLYHSYKVTLEYFWPKVVTGGVVLFDEYKQPNALRNFPGASKAIDDFLGERSSQVRFSKQANKHYLVKS